MFRYLAAVWIGYLIGVFTEQEKHSYSKGTIIKQLVMAVLLFAYFVWRGL